MSDASDAASDPKELVIRIKGASQDATLDDLIKCALADIRVKGFRGHIDEEYILRELVKLAERPRVRDSVRHDALRSLGQMIGLFGPNYDRNAQPANVVVTFAESLAEDPRAETAKVSATDARGSRKQAGERGKDAGGADGKVGAGEGAG